MEKIEEKHESSARDENLALFIASLSFTGLLAISIELTSHDYDVVNPFTWFFSIALFLFLLTWVKPSAFLNQALIFIGLSLTIFIFLLHYRDASHDTVFIVIERSRLFFIGIPLLASSFLLLVKVIIYKKVK